MVTTPESEDPIIPGRASFRFVRIRDSYFLDQDPCIPPQEIVTHSDLILDEEGVWEELIKMRDSDRKSVDAGTVEVQKYEDSGYMYIYSHSGDLKLPVNQDARYTTAREIQQQLGRPAWRVRTGIDVVYEKAGGIYVPRRAEDKRDPYRNMLPFRRR